MTVGELPFGEDGEPIENATFDNFGDEADDEDNADDEPFYLPEEDGYVQAEAPPPPPLKSERLKVVGGVLSTYADEANREMTVGTSINAANVRKLMAAVDAAEAASDAATRQERMELERLAALRGSTAAFETELLQLRAIGETKPNVAETKVAEEAYRIAAASEAKQAEVADKAFDAARQREVERDALLLELTQQRQSLEGRIPAREAEEAALRKAAPMRARREARGAERVVEAHKQAAESVIAQEHIRLEQAERQLEAARKGHKHSVEKLRERIVAQRGQEGKVDQGRVMALERRAEAVIQLKESTEAAAAELRAKNAQKYEREEKIAKEREEEKIAILAKGGNPYQVFRQRDEDARLAKERKKVQKTLEDNMTALQGRIVRDYQLEAKERETHLAHVKAVEEKEKAMSAAGMRDANAKYMQSVTKSKVTVLDPTSKERNLHPSKHMTVQTRPDWKFGLGMGTDPDIIDHIAGKHPDIAEAALEKAGKKVEAAKELAQGPEPVAKKNKLPEPGAASVRMMVHEAAARDEAVDELLEAEAEGLWEGAVEGVPGGSSKKKLDSSNPFGVRELSKLEKKYLTDAMGRQKGNQIVKQVVGGKTWEGPPFLCKPAEILFADFDVGSTYQLTFTLTNVSYTFNAFRPQHLPIAVRSFFELTHTPPGRMSAGVSANLSIVFTPKTNEDIDSEIPFLTSTGPMSIPLKARTKKCKIAIPNPTLDFGMVVMGEERTLALTIHNGGALACPLSLTVLHETQPEAGEEEGEDADDTPVFTFHGPKEVKGYATTTVMMRFAPRRAGDAACLYRVAFNNLSPDEEISVHGVGVEVPIYLEREVIDLECCAWGLPGASSGTIDGGLYRENVVLVNRSKVSHKVQLKVPRCLEGNLEFVPSMGYVQARSSFQVSLKLRAAEDLLVRCEQHATGPVLNVPVQVIVPEQVLPVSFTLRVQLTTPKLILERHGLEIKTLDFGACPINATRTLSLTLRNPSALPQRFGFTPIEKCLDVQPGDGLGTILPGESIERLVHFSPESSTLHTLSLTCRTSLNQSYTLKVLGQGISPLVTLSHTRLALPPTPEGDTTACDVTLTNESRTNQSFEMKPPEGSCLKISPAVGTLRPEESLRVLIEFTAPVNPDPTYSPYGQKGERDPVQEAAAAEEAARLAAEAEEARLAALEGEEGAEEEPPPPEPEPEADGEEGEAPAEEEVEVPSGPLLAESVASGMGEPWMLLAKPVISCFVRQEGKGFTPESTLFLSVETPVVAAPLALGGSGGVRMDLGFDSVPVGQTRIKTLTIMSKADVDLELTAAALDPMGPFSLINALPIVPARGSAEVNVRYSPFRQLPARETLSMSAGGCTLKVNLAGQGVSPTLRLDVPSATAPPPDPKKPAPPPSEEPFADKRVRLGGGKKSSMCFMGNLLSGDEITSTVIVENTSEFALRYHLVTLAKGHSNDGPLPPFDISPCEAEIAGGESLSLKVRFNPDHASDAYWHLYEVSVPNQEAEPHLLLLRGRSFATAGYLLAPDQQPIDGPALMNLPSRDLVGLPAPAASASGLVAGVSVPREMQLQLVPNGEEGVGSTKLLIGHAKPEKLTDIKPTPLEFSFEGLDDEAVRRGFSIEPLKGSLKEGEQVEVTVSFALKPEAMAGTELGVIASFGVSQWAEARVKCVLKGGSPPPVMPETEILLKGYIAGRSAGE